MSSFGGSASLAVLMMMSEKQTQTYEMLISQVDDLEVEFDGRDGGVGSFVFAGDSVDGPCAGYIELDGKVDWMVGG